MESLGRVQEQVWGTEADAMCVREQHWGALGLESGRARVGCVHEAPLEGRRCGGSDSWGCLLCLTSLSVKKARLGCRKVKEEPMPSRQKLPEPKPIQGCRDRREEQEQPRRHMGKGREGRNRGQPPAKAWLPGKVGGLLEGRQEWYGLGTECVRSALTPTGLEGWALWEVAGAQAGLSLRRRGFYM